MSTYVDVHKAEVVKLMWTGGGGQKSRFSCGRHKWMTPKLKSLRFVIGLQRCTRPSCHTQFKKLNI